MIALALVFMWISGFAAGTATINYFVATPYYKRLKLIHKEASQHNDTHHILIKKLTGL